MLTIGSLFAGIGGLELGLEWSGVGKTVWQVEADPFCRRILAKHWPEAQRFADVRTVGGCHVYRGGVLPPVDLICGGFPCQDISAAGKRAGLAGKRSGLWRQYERIVRETEPRWVVVENVAHGRPWVDAVRRALEELGYETLPIPMSARDVGAPHRRARIFVIGRKLEHTARAGRLGWLGKPEEPTSGCPGVADSRHDGREGSEARHGARRALGLEQGRDADGCDPSGVVAFSCACGAERKIRLDEPCPACGRLRDGYVSDADGQPARQPEQRRPGGRLRRIRNKGGAKPRHDRRSAGRDPQPLLGGSAHGLSAGVDEAGFRSARPVRWPALRGEPQGDWEPDRAVPTSALEYRGDRLRTLGNAVAPHCSEVIGYVIRDLEGW